MKKTLKIALLAVCMLCLLTGCYEQSTVISVNPLGGIKAEIAFVGNDEGIGQIAGGAAYADLQQSLLPQVKALVTDVSKEKVEEVALEKDGEEYKVDRVLDSIHEDIDEINASGKHPFTLSASMGVSKCKANAIASLDAVIEAADKRMYEEKRENKRKAAENK